MDDQILDQARTNLKGEFVSIEHYRRDMRGFAMLKKRIRKWIQKQKDISTQEILNGIIVLRSTFTDEFIYEIIDSRFDLEERRIVNTVMNRKPINREFYVEMMKITRR